MRRPKAVNPRPIADGWETMVHAPVLGTATIEDYTQLLIPEMIDKALSQTASAGLGYAEIPLPSYYAWVTWMEDELSHMRSPRFKSWEWCLGSREPDDDGNVHLCLLPKDHEGDCR